MEGTALLPVALDSNPQSEKKKIVCSFLCLVKNVLFLILLHMLKITEAYAFFSNDFILTNVFNS